MEKKFTIIISDDGSGKVETQMLGKGFHPLELVGYIEQCKFELLRKAENQGKQLSGLGAFLHAMGNGKETGGLNLEDLLGGLPPSLRRPTKDEDDD